MTVTPGTALIELGVVVERWEKIAPFRIAGHVFTAIETVRVTLDAGGARGQGEAIGIYYKGDTAERIASEIEAMREDVARGLDRIALQDRLPPGSARNALDCAFWDFEAKRSGVPVWQAAGLAPPAPLLTTVTIGADTPGNMAAAASRHYAMRALKLKLIGEPLDVERVRAVRESRPDAWLGVDANQGFTRDFLEAFLAAAERFHVALIEQPLPVGQEELLEGLASSIPIAADKSAQTVEDVEGLKGRFQTVNIKLDKCGGLTAALEMARRARAAGMRVMVGNMMGTSLAMAPACIVGQLCDIVDLDGPLFLTRDRANPVRYAEGRIACPPGLWGDAQP